MESTDPTRDALNRLYAKAQRIGRLEAHLDILKEIHRRIAADDRSNLLALADWVSARISEGLDASARECQ